MPTKKYYSILGGIVAINSAPQAGGMPLERFLLLAGVLGAAMILMMIGVFIMLRRSRSKPHDVAEAKPAPTWFKNLADTAGKTLAHADTPAMAVSQDAILVIRDPISTNWSVEVNGMRYASLKDIHDDKAAHKVLEALNGMQKFAGSIPIINATPDSTSAAISAPETPPSPLLVQPAAIILPIQTGRSPAQPRHPAAPGSLLEQVEKILQRNLMKYPQLEGSGVHIGATPQGGLQIEVGDSYYHAPDEVPDFTIRELIKTSILEWERTA